jgi:hypothetical protein
MWGKRLFGAIGAAALGGCVPVPAGVTDFDVEDTLAGEVRLSSTELVTILPRYAGADELSGCVAGKLQRSTLASHYYSADSFRDQLFPWFEPAVAPRSPEALAAVIGKPRVRERLAAIGVRYVISLQGYASERVAAYAGSMTVTAKTASLTATVMDLRDLRALGTVASRAAGEEFPAVILPAYIVAPTQTEVCKAVAERLIAYFGGDEAGKGSDDDP